MGGASTNYQVSRSLRFRASASAYLNRTQVSSNQKTWTWSAWVKRGSISSGSLQEIFSSYYQTGTPTYGFEFRFDTGDTITFNMQNNTVNSVLTTTQVFRDPSAWYHIVLVWDTTQATASNRVKIYVNGVQITAFSSATYPALNDNGIINSTVQTSIYLGAVSINGTLQRYFDGYLAEVNFVDGLALTPSSFGYYDPFTGVWRPRGYTGSYGTNGYELQFTDIATTSGSNFGLGKDFSGNGNYFNTNNISVTAGTTYDSMIDSPTPFADGTAYGRGNYCVMNSVGSKFSSSDASVSYSNGNLQTNGAAGTTNTNGTLGSLSGKFYYECYCNGSSGSGNILVGLNTVTSGYNMTVGIRNNGTNSGYTITSGAAFSYTTGDTLGVAFDLSTNSCIYYKNGVQQLTGTYGTSAPVTAWAQMNGAADSLIWNFGQRPFTYTPPTGYVALNTNNLPTPTIPNGAAYMAATTFTGNVSTNVINNGANTTLGTSFQPDMVWLKSRSNANNHTLYDSIRGINDILYPNLTVAAINSANNLTSFNTNGYTLGANENSNDNSGESSVGWSWKAGGTSSSNTSGSITSTVSANTTAGFSVVTYTGNGTISATVGHGLGVAPNMIIVKLRSAAGGSWQTYHSSIGATGTVYLDLTSATATNIGFWNNTAPTSSVFSIGNSGSANVNGSTFVAYCFAAVSGYSAFGSYTGNGSTDGPFVYVGFRPRYVMVKGTGIANWYVWDSSRSTYNVMNETLYPNLSNAEGGSGGIVDFLSNGFKLRTTGTDVNGSGNTIIYAAFAENPYKFALAR